VFCVLLSFILTLFSRYIKIIYSNVLMSMPSFPVQEKAIHYVTYAFLTLSVLKGLSCVHLAYVILQDSRSSYFIFITLSL
jgi:hypothetical protein